MTDYARGRADALREAMIIAATYIDWTGPGWDGAAKHIHDDIEALAQQPEYNPEMVEKLHKLKDEKPVASFTDANALIDFLEQPFPPPKRECGTCKFSQELTYGLYGPWLAKTCEGCGPAKPRWQPKGGA